MVEVVEEGVQFVSGCKPRSLGDVRMVCIIELSSEPSKHSSNGQVKLVVPVERSWIVDNCMGHRSIVRLCTSVSRTNLPGSPLLSAALPDHRSP